MRRFIIAASVMLIAVSAFAKTSRGFTVDYSRPSDSEMRLDFKVADFTVSVVEKDGVKYSKISGAGSALTIDKGFAEIPYHASAVQLKDDKNVTMKFNSEDYSDIVLDYPLLPSRGIISRSQNIDEIPYAISKESINNEWYPGKISEMTEPFIMRDVRGTHVIIYPYQYNSSTKTLRIYKNITVSLIEDNSEPVNPLTVKPAKVASEMDGMYKSIFLNYNETKALPIGSQGEILVVYTPNNGGLAAIQPWIDWKRQKGFKVHTLEKANGTDLYVTQDIKNQYLANTNILYAQIVGDFPNLKSQVLNSVTSTTGAQDPMLGCTVGTDQYIDVVVGRFSVTTEAELTNQINKSINYEKTPTLAATWYEKGIGIASNEGAGSGDDGEGDQAHSDIIINNKLLPFTYASVSTAYQANSVTKATILGFVNDGRSLINYTGHGNYDCFQSIYGGYLYNTDVNTLSNSTKLPFVVSVACLVGNVEYTSTCFAEAWTRHTNGGAVGGWFSSISQPWLPPMKGQDYFNDILKGGYDYSTQPGDGTNVTEQRTTVGTICCNASNLMLAETPTDASTKDTQEAWLIFGDVSLQLRTDPPKQITNSNTTLLPGNYTTTVTATTGGAAIAGVMVTLYKGGVNYTGVTNASGTVSIDHGFSVGDDVTLTVSGFNLETEQSVLSVSGSIGGTFAINQTSLSYGNVPAGTSSIKPFTITNSHATETITGNITTPTGYSVAVASKEISKDIKNVLGYAVAPNSSKTFNLSFEPAAGQVYSGNVVVTSSDDAHPTQNIAVTGTGTVPEAEVSVTDITASAAPETAANRSFNINNTGLAELTYSIAINYTSGKDVKGSGGPDAYGYKWKDSDEPDGPDFVWTDISGTGTLASTWTAVSTYDAKDEGYSGPYNLGFTFNFYGVDYTQVYITSNGYLTFVAPNSTYTFTNAAIPTGAYPGSLIAAFWDDLEGTDQGTVHYQAVAGKFTVQFTNWPLYGGTAGNTYQMALNSSGKIEFFYNNMTSTLTSATVGIENAAGTIGTQIAYNAAYIKNSLAVQISATPEWLSLDNTSGVVSAGKGSVTIGATCDATGLELGTYTADLTVTTNDPDEGTVIIPVTFTVSNIVVPGTPSNVTTSVSGTDLTISWTASANATSYDVYSSTEPYGTYTLETNVATTSYTTTYTAARKFWYVVGKNATK